MTPSVRLIGRAVIVGEPMFDTSWADEVVVMPEIIIEPPHPAYIKRAKWSGIRLAMLEALVQAGFGDVIMQRDVQFFNNPFVLAPITGVRNLVDLLNPNHVCPRAFIIYDDDMKTKVLDAWSSTSERACTSWTHLPITTTVMARHASVSE